jgi:hypothetical protein
MLSSTPEFYKVSHQKKDYDEKGYFYFYFFLKFFLVIFFFYNRPSIARHNAVFGGKIPFIFMFLFSNVFNLFSCQLKEKIKRKKGRKNKKKNI